MGMTDCLAAFVLTAARKRPTKTVACENIGNRHSLPDESDETNADVRNIEPRSDHAQGQANFTRADSAKQASETKFQKSTRWGQNRI